ncbi:MAG: hypothetical protein KAR19_18545 [Bacteroidales bacterium]|nr:hypothetical protein [Bacteroidales bacterium]
MRKYLWPLFALSLLAGTSCQQKIGIEKEKEAILAVFQEEVAAIRAGDMERALAVHVQDSMETRLELGIYGYHTYKGWDEVGSLLEDALEGWQVEDAVNWKENVILKVTGNTAWLTCDNIWEWSFEGEPGGYNNIQITFLEKIKGEWKISFSAYYTKPVPVTEFDKAIDIEFEEAID